MKQLTTKQIEKVIKGRKVLFDVLYETTWTTIYGTYTQNITMRDCSVEGVRLMAADSRYKILKVTPLKVTAKQRMAAVLSCGGPLD